MLYYCNSSVNVIVRRMSVDCRLSLGNIGYAANFSYFLIYCIVLYLLYCIGLRALCILDAQMCEVSRDIARTTGAGK